MTHWSLIMVLVLMVFGSSSSVAQDETEEHENVVFDYLILPPMEDEPGGSAKPRPKNVFKLLPMNSENNKNMMGLDATAMKQTPQAPYKDTARHPHHKQASHPPPPPPPPPPARYRNPEATRRLMHTPPPSRQPQRDPNAPRHSHYSPEGNQPSHHAHENPRKAQYKPDRGRHRHHDPNSPQHAHHTLKTNRNIYETATPEVQYHTVENIRMADPNPNPNSRIVEIDNTAVVVPVKTGIPYLDNGITGNPLVNPENNVSPYNPEIKVSNYARPEVTRSYARPEVSMNYNPEISALPYVHPVPDITVTNYEGGEISIKPYDVNPYRESDINQNAYNIQPRTKDPYYAPSEYPSARSSGRAERTDPSYDVGENRKHKYYRNPHVNSDEIDKTTYGTSTVVYNRHYHAPQVEKRDDFFASYDRDYSTVATEQSHSSSGKPVLECYSCYSSAKTSRACIEPTKNGVGVLPCKDPRELCYSTFLKSGNFYLSIQRGCMLECHDSIVTECCNENRCNSKKPAAATARLTNSPAGDCATQHGPPSILFFLTILLLLHTVVKVAYL